MPYWIYENYPTNRSTIHDATCAFCNHGMGRRAGTASQANGKWHGPYGELDHATTAAALLGRPTRTHVCRPQSIEHTTPAKPLESVAISPYKRFQLEPIDESTLSLPDLFHRRMLQIYVSLRDEVGYCATRFLTSVRRHGGVQHAKRSLQRPIQMQTGFERLREEGRLHQTMEAHVCDAQFRDLFTPTEVAEARRRLSIDENANLCTSNQAQEIGGR